MIPTRSHLELHLDAVKRRSLAVAMSRRSCKEAVGTTTVRRSSMAGGVDVASPPRATRSHGDQTLVNDDRHATPASTDPRSTASRGGSPTGGRQLLHKKPSLLLSLRKGVTAATASPPRFIFCSLVLYCAYKTSIARATHNLPHPPLSVGGCPPAQIRICR
jgi:hypothetical protein